MKNVILSETKDMKTIDYILRYAQNDIFFAMLRMTYFSPMVQNDIFFANGSEGHILRQWLRMT